MKKKMKVLIASCAVGATMLGGFVFSAHNIANANQNNILQKKKPIVGDYDILFHWNHLDWDFIDDKAKKEFEEKEAWKGAMPAGFKMDSKGNYYLSVPRWAEGIPSTLNKVVLKDGKPLLEAFPSWDMNKEGDQNALQSVLGYEIDENNTMWILDQGHINSQPSVDGSQKLVHWDLNNNKMIEAIKIPNDIASYNASFLNDLVVDNKNGFVYIADSGIFSDPLQGGIIVYNMKTKQFRRVLHQHYSTQDVKGFHFSIAGKNVNKDSPMRTGADGIALSADRSTLYFCPLTGRNLYSINTAYLQDFTTPEEVIEKNVEAEGSKGTNTDGMTADNKGNVFYTMLEGQGVGMFDPKTNTHRKFISDDRMIWVDGIQLDNKGYMLFNSNRLHELFSGELDWNDPYNFIIWKAYVGEKTGSYLK